MLNYDLREIEYNDQLSAVCPELVESRKVAKLPNPYKRQLQSTAFQKSKSRKEKASTKHNRFRMGSEVGEFPKKLAEWQFGA